MELSVNAASRIGTKAKSTLTFFTNQQHTCLPVCSHDDGLVFSTAPTSTKAITAWQMCVDALSNREAQRHHPSSVRWQLAAADDDAMVPHTSIYTRQPSQQQPVCKRTSMLAWAELFVRVCMLASHRLRIVCVVISA